MSNYDFSEVPSRELIDPGVYEAEIIEVKLGQTSKGDPQKQIIFRLINGKKISDFIVDTKKSWWRIQFLFEACGYKSVGKVKISDDWKEIWEKPLQIQIDTQEYRGKQNSRVVNYAPIPDLDEEPVEA